MHLALATIYIFIEMCLAHHVHIQTLVVVYILVEMCLIHNNIFNVFLETSIPKFIVFLQ
jgi:hypothetical protein